LIELLVVVAIIGVLAAAGIVGYTNYLNGVKNDTQKNNAITIAQALKTAAVARAGGLTVAPAACATTATARACAVEIANEGKFKSPLVTDTTKPGTSPETYIAAANTASCSENTKGLLIVTEPSNSGTVTEGAVIACDKDGAPTPLGTANFGKDW
jgi:type IV pilus assembly protein PilA